jgi:hypothetical protein
MKAMASLAATASLVVAAAGVAEAALAAHV